MTDMKTRPLTTKELAQLRARLAQLDLPRYKAAQKLGVSQETLLAALTGKRIQPAKRATLLKET
jgi:predicted DNA-binding protein (UPF0251 family)